VLLFLACRLRLDWSSIESIPRLCREGVLSICRRGLQQNVARWLTEKRVIRSALALRFTAAPSARPIATGEYFLQREISVMMYAGRLRRPHLRAGFTVREGETIFDMP